MINLFKLKYYLELRVFGWAIANFGRAKSSLALSPFFLCICAYHTEKIR